MSNLDPDRFFNFQAPGAQEWWYFDAIADGGRDALVIVFYAALPFDPAYGVSALKHLRNPRRFPAPNPLDHCAIGFQWYRLDGSTMRRIGPGNPGPLAQAYALNSYRRNAFAHSTDPFQVEIGRNRLERDAQGGYRLVIDTPDVSGRTIRGDLRLKPSPGSRPFEIDLGTEHAPHHWILSAADGRFEGTISIDGPNGGEFPFQGRGYHDHNAGVEELSLAMKRWEWGRFHFENLTEVYYLAQPRQGPERSLWLTCRDGRPEVVRKDIQPIGDSLRRNLFGLTCQQNLTLQDGDSSRLNRKTTTSVDAGPFYQRWLSEFQGSSRLESGSERTGIGISEVLDTRNLNHPLFNWMIPFRLKRLKN